MRTLLDKLLILGGLGSLFLAISCQDASPPSPEDAGVEPASGNEEKSPNAKILPEPLQQNAPPHSVVSGPLGTGGQGSARAPQKRAPVLPWPTTRSLPEDPVKQSFGSGYEMVLRFAWPEARKFTRLEKESEAIPTWPSLRVQLLRESPGRPARMRITLSGRSFPLPPNSEFRARADRKGYALIWPDGRSYRIIPPGALRSVFNDQRVDRMPFVKSTHQETGLPRKKPKDLRTLTLSTPIGRARLVTTRLRDLPFASVLLCKTLLEFLRVEGNAKLCPLSELPLKFEVAWSGDQKLLIEVSELKPSTELLLEKFRTPPPLPIFKNGELPPFDDYVFNENERLELFALTTIAKPPRPTPPSKSPPSSPETPPKEPPPPPRPANEVMLHNTLDRPAIFIMNGIPLLWLAPGKELPLYTKTDSVRFSARDFLGETLLSERQVTTPTQIRFGEKAPPSLAGEKAAQ